MNIGMLWFDNDKQTDLPAKLARAAEYYKSKYGAKPTLCLVNPRDMPGASTQHHADMTVCTSRTVLPDHFWLGLAANLPETPPRDAQLENVSASEGAPA